MSFFFTSQKLPIKNTPAAKTFFLLLFFTVCLHTVAADRPNILLIFSDDQGMNDVSCYGSEIPTPNIDSIAKHGVKFESFYVASPVCTPSRFGLLTGRYPNRAQGNLMHALMFLETKDDQSGIRPNETTIATVLKNHGYNTGLIGKWHLGHGSPQFSPRQHGFDHFYGTRGGCVDYFTLKYGPKPDWYRNEKPLEEKGYSTDLITDEAVRFLKKQKKKTPFFLYLAYNAPHYGKGWDEENKKLSNILQAKDKDRERFKHIEDKDRREFAGMVAAMDDGIGRVLETLKKEKLDKNTLVIFTCDNGADPRYGGSNKPFRGQKAQLFEGGIHVPCVARWPEKIKEGTVIREPVIALDWFPTFCDFAEVARKDLPLDGTSIAPLLSGGKIASRDLIWEYQNVKALRRGPWKFVRTGKDEFLFNLENDPYEKTNLAEEKADLVKELKEAHEKVALTFHDRLTNAK